MRTFFTLILLAIGSAIIAQSAGDTIVVPTFNYTQTSGSGIRDTMIDFPDDPNLSFEKVIMRYNMRCKDGLVSVPGNTNRGCGEWDYSCNTYITDSSRVDSVISYTASHSISAFSGSTFEYVETPLYDYYQYRQKEVVLNSTTSETTATVGSGSLSLSHPIAADNNSGKSQYLFLASELTSAGLQAGDIDAMLLEVSSGSADADYFQLRMKHSSKSSLDPNDPDMDDFTEVYFYDYSFSPASNRIQFYNPFVWNGADNIIVELTFTNNQASNAMSLEGEDVGSDMGIYAHNGYHINSVNGKIEVPTTAFSSISDELTVSFWSYGNEQIQPIHNSIIHGVDSDNKRQLNLHLPWGNSSIYYDCGNDGSGYDRINKAASPAEFRGSWNHWAITKNAVSGDMKIYLNGSLWHSGTGKNRLIDIQELILATSGNADRSWYGKFDEFRFWDKELSETTIQDWMYRSLDASHPHYSNLLAYYMMDEGMGNTTVDASPNAETASILDFLYWLFERGLDIDKGFTATTERPNITFAQGEYTLTITDQIITDSVMLTPSIVREYEIIPRYGTMLHDSINEVSVDEYWETQYQRIFDPEGIAIDSFMLAPTASIEIEELTYFKRYPSKFEIMSFVTPYGIYLDLGMEGKTWFFDVTDYTPILNGQKRMTIERGGQRQEDMDIQFLFIVGTPAHEVLDIAQVWRPDSRGYTSIIDDRSFEAREFYFLPDGDQYKFRSVITGHGQQGEFTGRYHFLNINEGDPEYTWKVWTECSEIAIYPQGGTWIYDRAGWCPGTPSDLYEYDITEYVSPGQSHMLDYGLEYASGTSNYIVNNQLVTYGVPNFTVDAAVTRILKPNSEDASEERFNPACSNPEIVIRNTGATTLTSLDIDIQVEGGEVVNHNWTGSLQFLEQDTVTISIDDLSFWMSGGNTFTATISNPNGQDDEYEHNNVMSSTFEDLPVYPDGSYYTFRLLTNNYGHQSSYTLRDGSGTQLYKRDNCDDNTLYEDEFLLWPGCFELRIEDSGDNGLEFWHQPQQGVGSFKLVDAEGNVLHTFDPDFGGFASYEFGIGNITRIQEVQHTFEVAVYPNPVSNYLNIDIDGANDLKMKATLSNMVTSVVFEKSWVGTSGQNNIRVNMEDFPAGIYFLTIASDKQSRTEKIIKY